MTHVTGTSAASRLQSRYQEIARSSQWQTMEGKPLGFPAPPQSWNQPDTYWSESLTLAMDPARGNKIGQASLEEAAVALHAFHSGVLESPVREATGASEFVDANGQFWDVKSPLSPPQGSHWSFDAYHQLEVVQKEVQGNEKVLLNLSRCTADDAAQVKQILIDGLSDWEENKVVVLVNGPAQQAA